jgi:hypothetical protein
MQNKNNRLQRRNNYLSISQIRIETNKNREKKSQINRFVVSSTRKENDVSWRWSNGIGLEAVKNNYSFFNNPDFNFTLSFFLIKNMKLNLDRLKNFMCWSFFVVLKLNLDQISIFYPCKLCRRGWLSGRKFIPLGLWGGGHQWTWC